MARPQKPEADKLDNIRHSLAHLLAAAVLKKFPDAKLGIGPTIESGFYYDFLLPRTLTPDDLAEFEKTMRELIHAKLPFSGKKVTAADAKKLFAKQQFKLDLIKEFAKDKKPLMVYYAGDVFMDLCRGGHVKNTSEIPADAFRLDRLAGAYWRGDEKNPQLQRVYGLAFGTKKELKEYLTLREEAEKRDHKKLGRELGLFAFSPLVGAGLPLFLPKGTFIRTELENYIRSEKEKHGYAFVWTPHIAKSELYKKSGHLGKYGAMMPPMKTADGEEYIVKPMNCPHHFEIYNSEPHSYKGLPFRIAENTTVYRNEKSGELSGLVRVKSLTQDDTHHVVRPDQIDSEIKMILGLMGEVYKTMGFRDYQVQISIRDPQHPENYFGDNALWKKSEKLLVETVKQWGRPYAVEKGEAAFYGPKIDIMAKDSLGRAWQLTTVQLDFSQPENFNMTYVDERGKKARPAILHVAILGSIERFMGILIEHFAGAFPLWLAPVQAEVINVGSSQREYAKKVYQGLKNAGLRAELSDENLTVGKRIREAELQKVPYILVVGEKEEKNGTVNVRNRKNERTELKIEKFLEKVGQEIKEKTI